MMTQLVLQLLLFLLASAQYNTQLAGQSCFIAKLASSPDCTQCQQGLIDITYFQILQKKLQGVAAYSQIWKAIFVAFRGTKQAENWKLNLKIKAKKYDQCGNCSIHSGFAQGASLLYPQVAKAVNKLVELHGLVPVVMTGHSLGGGLAALVGLQLMQQLKLNTTFSLYTFGAPRAGNKQSSEYANTMFKESYRIVFKKDAVPHLPPKFQGYTHFGTEIWYNTIASYKTCTGDNKEKCSNSVFLMLLKKSDHKLDNYLKLYEDSPLLSSPLAAKDELQADGLQGFDLFKLIAEYEKRKQISEFAN